MGVDSSWEHEDGTSIERIGDPQNRLCRFLQGADLRGTVCLRFLDPFGDTTFNQLQIVVLVEELQGIVSAQPEPEVRDHLRRILDLAIRARGQAHTYLKFFGD